MNPEIKHRRMPRLSDATLAMLAFKRRAVDRKSLVVSYLLLVFLGGLGAHRFYLGKTWSGVGMLCLWLVGVGTFIIYVGVWLLMLLFAWVVIDAFQIPRWVRRYNDPLGKPAG